MHKKLATVTASKEKNQLAEWGARKTYFSLNTILCCVAFSYCVHVLHFLNEKRHDFLRCQIFQFRDITNNQVAIKLTLT